MVRRFAVYRIGERERVLSVIASDCEAAEEIAARLLGCAESHLMAYQQAAGGELVGPGVHEGQRMTARARSLGILPRRR